ncbi:MAG: cobalt ECF transporter T component CbiQ [Bacteroidetes bacterium]|nr:cobalt ECF transporter T component CbiQ [Bacteroidota bacterium]
MNHSFIDKYSDINSPIHRFDPRLKFIFVILCVAIIVSQPRGQLLPYAFYGMMVISIMLLSRIPITFMLRRMLFVLPFILMASLFYPISIYIYDSASFPSIQNEAFSVAFSIFFKGSLSVILLILLISTEKFHNIISGMRMLKMPKIIGVISALMYRYIFIFSDEAMKTSMARNSRTPGRLKVNKIKVYGNQMAMIFIRSWDRSQNIYNAMVSRGFNGEFATMKEFKIKKSEIALFTLAIIMFLVIRVGSEIIL